MTDIIWKNRITGYGTEAPDQLLANPANFRIHPKRQQDALSGSLDTLGYIQTVIVNRTTQRIIDGHLRVSMALREGQAEIPVTYVELTEVEEAQALLSLDPIAAMAASDADKVDELLRMIQTDDERVMQHLADLAKENGLDYGQPEQGDALVDMDRAGELLEKWKVTPGQLWTAKGHRILCGDCTNRADVERLMQGESADFSFTDPPYNVGIKYGKGTNDNQGKQEFINWCHGWTVHLPGRHLLTVGIKRLTWWDDILGDPQWIIAWVKRNGQGQTGLGGTNKWDAILVYGVEHDHKTDMIELNNDYSEDIKADGGHPTAKPVELWQQIIERFNGQVVYEPFGGSGTTVIACENLGRRCMAMELEPKYVSVILERLSIMGLQPVLGDSR